MLTRRELPALDRSARMICMNGGKIDVLVGTPCYGGVVTQTYMQSYLALQEACRERGIGLDLMLLGGDSLITRARNQIAAWFLEKKRFTHLMFIDADIGFESAQFMQLVDRNVDIAAGIYPLKRIDWEKVRERAVRGDSDLETASLNYVLSGRQGGSGTMQVQARGGFASVEHAGTGFMLIKRAVFERMIERHPELAFAHHHLQVGDAAMPQRQYAFFDTSIDKEAGTYLSEDYTFCRRWIAMGGDVWVNLASKLTHVGSHAYRGDFSTQVDKIR
jgi:hypothetical protein